MGSVLTEVKPAALVNLDYTEDDVKSYGSLITQLTEFLYLEDVVDRHTGKLVTRGGDAAPTFDYMTRVLLATNFESLIEPERFNDFIDRTSDTESNRFMTRLRDLHTQIIASHSDDFLTKYITKLYGSLERLTMERQDPNLLEWPDIHVAHPTLWIMWVMSSIVTHASHADT
jgi:hypothetical protein